MKKKAIKLLFLLLILSFNASADSASATFTPPTTRVDGTALPLSEIAGFNIFVDDVKLNSDETIPAGTSDTTLPNTATSFSISVDTGVHTIAMSTIDADGRESTKSESIPVNVFSTPNPPALNSSILITIAIQVQ